MFIVARQRIVPLGLRALSAFALLHCAAGEELDLGAVHDAAVHQNASSSGAGGTPATTGAGGTATTTGGGGDPSVSSGAGGSSGNSGVSANDASAAAGSAGVGGSPKVDSGPADMGMAVYDVAPCTTCALSVQYSVQKAADPTQEVAFNMTVRNTGTKAVPMNQIAVRYWYTINGEAAQESAIDYSNPSSATIQFVKVAPARTGADYYAEIKLTAGGDLAVGANAQLNLRFHKAGYQGTYNQGDDYSFAAGHATLADWPKMTAYVGGAVAPVWGTEP